ncbi:hypothetical protein COT75_04575 [Candidatus Beckwithbacteria bacterium CG10_big_fil_rev_8_21_14_0_10_34_10]|uniref:Peptidase M23 domain-containing protein n=1 Tax=Candidatus Beckwithbacteria bacterium CG10_big_fil_rev_8_21_14_0_10_34_10 TaxID=1974495 RepID=A0A2H0W866_9BACT|nr:MAG: hypothetical protein COT75_04575 [Candidatus Beckwithbacteria bacterium CG10_big_fil_rev_8_21_14_0_10_34_10]
MKVRIKLALVLLTVFLVCFGFFASPLKAGEEEDKLNDLNKKIQEYESKISELQGEQKTLASTIGYLDSKIGLAQTQILATEQELKILTEEINQLSAKIGILDNSLADVSEILSSRIQETYKRGLVDPIHYLFTSSGLGEAMSRLKYLKIVQLHDRDLLFQMQKSKMNYDTQKSLKEEKQKQEEELKAQLQIQKVSLDTQKQEKAYILQKTKNDEQEYQRLLTVARAEYQAIQGIIAGYGDETKVGHINEGQRIASVIAGGSCNSSGTHLHFMVVKNNEVQNPFNYLKQVSYRNCSGGGDCVPADSFNPSGSWNWPLNPEITLNQGYGHTWAVQNTWVGQIYSFHNGIDIEGSSNEVKAVQGGTLYRGSYNVGCSLRYVKLEHDNSDLETLYLHVNY